MIAELMEPPGEETRMTTDCKWPTPIKSPWNCPKVAFVVAFKPIAGIRVTPDRTGSKGHSDSVLIAMVKAPSKNLNGLLSGATLVTPSAPTKILVKAVVVAVGLLEPSPMAIGSFQTVMEPANCVKFDVGVISSALDAYRNFDTLADRSTGLVPGAIVWSVGVPKSVLNDALYVGVHTVPCTGKAPKAVEVDQ